MRVGINRNSPMMALKILMFMVAPLAAWMTNIAVNVSSEAWMSLVVGLFVFPAGVVNGTAIWLGVL